MNILFALFLLPLTLQAAIYGSNNLTLASNPKVAILAPNNFFEIKGNKVTLKMDSLENNAYVCQNNPWKNYRSFPVSCTGFLIAPDIMVTAGHCMVNFGEVENMKTPQCEGFTFLFDVHFQNGNVRKEIDLSSVAECETVIKARHVSEPTRDGKINFNEDYAIIKLKKPMRREFFQVSKTKPKVQDKVSFYGYPLGTGLFKGDGKVLSLHPHYFRTNLDAFPGHSGSPVLDQKGKVIGLLVRGYPESLIDSKTANCNEFNKCDENANSCLMNDPVHKAGEHVQFISALPLP